MNIDFFYLIIPIWVIVVIMLVGIGLQFAKERKFDNLSNDANSTKIKLEELSVIIPFRNEENRLKPLLDSINKSTKLPHEFIFVNDHSDDNSILLIQNGLNKIPFKIIDSMKEGKKMALREGIDISNSTFILTFDADISFESIYFENISQLVVSDMLILPVKMTSKRFKFFYILDVILANLTNVISTGYYRPIIASGANLLFRKDIFSVVDSIENHKHISSGDDLFLLNDFRRMNREIILLTNSNLEVKTKAPGDFKELIAQRVRWISKTKKVNDSFANFVGIIQFLVLLTIVISAVYISIQRNVNDGLIYYAIAIFSIYIGTMPYLHRANLSPLNVLSLAQWLIYLALLPFYSILMLILSLTYKPNWKGRKIGT